MRADRSWWQVPLWSPMHLLATCSVVLVLLFVAGKFQGSSNARPGPSPSSSAITAESPTSSSTSRASVEEPSEASAPVPTPPVARRPLKKSASSEDVAAAFVATWARRYDETGTWRSGVMELSTPGFAELLRKADPLHVPATKSLGHPKLLKKTKGSRVIQVATDSGPVAVTTVKTSGRWLVGGIRPVEEGR